VTTTAGENAFARLDGKYEMTGPSLHSSRQLSVFSTAMSFDSKV